MDDRRSTPKIVRPKAGGKYWETEGRPVNFDRPLLGADLGSSIFTGRPSMNDFLREHTRIV